MVWKKVLAIFFSASVIIAIVALGISYFVNPSEEEIVEAKEKVETTFYTDVNDKDTPLFSENMNEYQIQQIIHAMSHQKVKADHKWGAILMTHARVGILIDVVKVNESQWEHPEIYLDILNRWHENDFSQADKDHNIIWEMQGGTLGKAKGLLNAVEERRFLSGEDL